MKKTSALIIILLVITSLLSRGQAVSGNGEEHLTKTDHKFRDFSIAASPGIIYDIPQGTKFGGGVKLRTYFGRYFSLDGEIHFSHDYVNLGPGLFLIPCWYLLNGASSFEIGSSGELVAWIFLTLLTGEHFAVHIPVNNFMDISPYVSLLSYKEIFVHNGYANRDYAPQQGCFTSGIEVTRYYNRFFISGFGSVNYGYTDHNFGCTFGAYFGFYFPSRLWR